MATGTIKIEHNGKTFYRTVALPVVPESREKEWKEYKEREDKKKARLQSIEEAMQIGMPDTVIIEWEESYNDKTFLVYNSNIDKYLDSIGFNIKYDYINQFMPSLNRINNGGPYDIIIMDFIQEFDYDFLVRNLTKLNHNFENGNHSYILALLPTWWDNDEKENKYIFNSYFDGCGVELNYLSTSCKTSDEIKEDEINDEINDEIIKEFDILDNNGKAEKYEWVKFWLSSE